MNHRGKCKKLLLIMASLGALSSPGQAKDLAVVGSPVDADVAISQLKAGNRRFVDQHPSQDGQNQRDVQRLAKGQAPKAIVLSCSDSRVPPELVFNQGLGDLFAVRTAGETLSPEVIASIEYAVAKLGSHLIVVLGHSNCGAVKAAIETMGGKSAGSDHLDQLVRDIHPRIRSVLKPEHPSTDLKAESWANAKAAKDELLVRSKIISEASQSGKVRFAVGLYDLSTGAVEFE